MQHQRRISVGISQPSGSRIYHARWTDPLSGARKWKTTGTDIRRDAERFKFQLEKELNDGTYAHASRTTWADFRLRYEQEVLSGLAMKTAKKAATTFGYVEHVINPKLLRQVDANAISKLTKHLRELGRAAPTIVGHLAYLQAALNWAETMGMIPKVPKIVKPKRVKKSKSMKGRPITTEELERLLAKVEDVVGPQCAPSWHFFLWGLWWSGLRLEESLELWWDRDDRLSVILDGRQSTIRIPAELEKAHQDRLLPMPPEFVEFLEAVPESERTGRIFNPQGKRMRGERLLLDTVSKIGCKIGKAANVVVNVHPVSGKVKYASAHDLRRSFGERWATRIMPKDLKVVMRHKSIETTMKYYVGSDAKKSGAVLWDALPKGGRSIGSAPVLSGNSPAQKKMQVIDNQ